MKKAILLLAVSMFLCGFVCDNNPTGPGSVTPTDADVYHAVLSYRLKDSKMSRVVLGGNTRNHLDQYEDAFDLLHNKIVELQKTTITDYLMKNATSIRLQDISGPENVDIILEDPETRQTSVGFTIGLSRVGYNKYSSQAIVTTSEFSGPLYGTWQLYLLRRVKNSWVVEKEHILVIFS